MLYRDLVQFEPIETVIQLRDADQVAKAENLVRTYVISERMADQLANLVIRQLQFDAPQDNKGVLIVGNYGTGKSHLMSVISAVAEFPEVLPAITNPTVRQAAGAISGRFKVLRIEIGSVTGSLRDILLNELQDALASWGIPFEFPPASEVTNNKDIIIGAVAAFQERYPEQGLLLVVDELLDYLRSRREQQLILDLGFLRELGEVAALTAFRFLGGLQETLFDSPRFAFVAEQLRRVRDRFEQVRISREDIAYVVANRLLRKSDEQLSRITEHLRRFTPLYSGLADRLGEYVRLYPIHPAYIATFERVYVAEKREVLKTFSQAMRELLDREVPADQPGLVAYDHYWDVLRENPSMRSLPDVAMVIEKSNVLEGRIRNAYTRPHLKPMALRIIYALSVHRLTTSDINVPLGATARELCDDLCLYVPLPEFNGEFLLSQVQVSLREIMRTVTGQFISYNEANDQYYLDLKKDVDFDAKIAECGQAMGPDELNRYFFDALRQVLSLSDTTYVTGHRIWGYELPWEEHHVTRPGYLFFGAPDERSTAQPPRDFYVYILPPFFDRAYHDERRQDEVIWRFTALDESFERLARAYAGAREMALSTPNHRAQYEDKARAHQQALARWLRDDGPQHLQIVYQGVPEPLRALLGRLHSTESRGIEELLRGVSAHLLAPAFAECYTDYPAFPRLREPISEQARAASAQDAIRMLAGRGRTNLAQGVLQGLGLLDGQGVIHVGESRYVQGYLQTLQTKAEGQVVNRGEVIQQVAGGIQPVEKDLFYQLEPEWTAVLLVALVYNGDIELSLSGGRALDASNVEQAAVIAVGELASFRFYRRTRNVPVNAWAMVYEGLGLAPALVRDENTRERALQELQRVVQGELQRTATLQGQVQQGLRLWNEAVFTDLHIQSRSGEVIVEVEAGVRPVRLLREDLAPTLRVYKGFLEELSHYNSPGRLRNLRLSEPQIGEDLQARQVVGRIERLVAAVDQLQPLTAYLAEAQANLPGEHPWSERAAAERVALLNEIRHLGRGEECRAVPELLRELGALKNDYGIAYAEMHRRLALGPQADDQRQRLYADPRLSALNALASIDLLPRSELEAWKQAIAGLITCREFHEGVLENAPTCPFCHLRPAQHNAEEHIGQTLGELDGRLGQMLTRWRQALRANLQSEHAQQSLQAMAPQERSPIESFLAQGTAETAIPVGFAAAATQALRGIQALPLETSELLAALAEGGLPCTLDDLQRRFNEYLAHAMRGHDPHNTRLTLDRSRS